MHVKSGDEVFILAGKDKGKSGKITQAMPREGRVIVEGVNMIKRHTKPRGPGKPGGIIEREAAINVSNVQLVCPHCRKLMRVAHRFIETTDGSKPRKVRYCRKCDKTIDE
jgi:large subunit ribosomal protein L24